jgi:beta-N-acetylhexosaminidase
VTRLAAINLNFNPVADLGPIAVRWEAVFTVVALLFALAVASSTAPSREQLLLILVGIVPGAVVGGRAVHVLDYAGNYLANPATIVNTNLGSLSLLGAVVGGSLSALYVVRVLRAPVAQWADIAAIPLLIALGGGKLAQLLGGSGQGAPFDGPWAVSFTGNGPWVGLAANVPSHPSQVYEGLWLLVGIPLVLALRNHRFVGAVSWFLVGRLLVGFTWRDSAVLGPLNMEQLVALAILAAAALYAALRTTRVRRTATLALCLTLVAGCGSSTSPISSPKPTPLPSGAPRATPTNSQPPTSSPDATATPTTASIDQVVAQMSVDEKVGQLFMVSFYGDKGDETDATQVAQNQALIGTDNIAAAIARYHLGGVIYFSWAGNLVSATQIATLSNAIQADSAMQSPAIPLLISTDQEGGSIVRLPSPATQFPGNMALGATGSTDLARAVGKAMGQELRAVGINQVLAPDADVNVNPANPIIGVRSFGSDATSVASMTSAMITGFQTDAGVGATVKHFPGHGDTDVDSHTALPLITHSAAQWASVDKPPFAAAIAGGVDAIMVGHLAFPALDASGTPSSLSAAMVTDLLRNQMGFDGMVITDSLQMGALRNTYGDAHIPVMAIQAGDDMLLMPQSLPVAWNAVRNAVTSGQISMARLDASVRRILTLKQELGLFGAAPVSVDAAPTALGTSAHRTVEQRAAESSVTLLANDAHALPMDAASGGPYLVVGPTTASVSELVGAIGGRGWTVGGTVTGTSPTSAAIDKALTHAPHYETIIVLTLDADKSAGQRALVSALAATGKRLIAVSIGRPYDQASYGAPTSICLYSGSTASLDAFVRVMFGEIAPAGHLPVAIPDPSVPGKVLYPIGYGLSY